MAAFSEQSAMELLQKHGFEVRMKPVAIIPEMTAEGPVFKEVDVIEAATQLSNRVYVSTRQYVEICKVCGEPFQSREMLYEHYDSKHNKGQ